MLLVKCRTGTRRYWAAFKTRSLKATDCSALDKSQPWTLLAGCWYGDFRKPKSYGKGITVKGVKVICRIRPRWIKYWLG